MINKKPIKRESFSKGDSVCASIKESSLSDYEEAKLKGFFLKAIIGDSKYDCTVLLNGKGFNIPFHIRNNEKIIRTRCLLLEKCFSEY